jgi:hypothetical protein
MDTRIETHGGCELSYPNVLQWPTHATRAQKKGNRALYDRRNFPTHSIDEPKDTC